MGWHREWRKLAKKCRRKRIRSTKAKEEYEKASKEQEQREKSPTYIAWVKEQDALEAFAVQEEQRLSQQRQLQWEAEEEAAQIRWNELQIRLAQAKAEKAKQELLIKEEWDREQEKLKLEQEQKEKEKEEKRKLQEELLAQIDAFISGTADLPASTIVSTETRPGHPACPFFSKTGACRFKDSCSRNHVRPGISKVLMFMNFYEHFGIQSSLHNEYDTDVGLEYEDSETYTDFLEFYKDILPEFETCGEIRQLKVCNNHEPHLRGNVYVEYYSERNALKAYQLFQGRYYGGRQLNVSFTCIPSWKSALCGLFHKQKCPKGKRCNFIHAFKNPNNAFKDADFDRSPRHSKESPSHRRHLRSPENWRWSVSPERQPEKKRERSKTKRNRRDRSREKYNSRDVSSKRRRKRSRSRSRSDSPRSRRSKKDDRELVDVDGDKSHQRAKRSSYSERHSEKSKSSKKLDHKNSNKSVKKAVNKYNEERTPESG